MFALLGGDVIGMTNVQETIIAKEFGLKVASLAYVSNMGAGLQRRQVSRLDNAASVNRNANDIQNLFREVIERFVRSGGPADYVEPEIEIIPEKNLH